MNTILDNDMVAIGRENRYIYSIILDDDQKENVPIEIIEWIDIENKKKPVYSLKVNKEFTMFCVEKNNLPKRFLFIIDAMDHYINEKVNQYEDI